MAKVEYWQYFIDKKGKPRKNTQVRVYLAGTSIEANIYIDKDFGTLTTSSEEDLKTNLFGFVQFWVGDSLETEGGYDVDQQFKVVCNVDEIDNIYLFAPVRSIKVSDAIKGIPSNKDFDKVISNLQGYNWDDHVNQIVPSASPHDLQPVDLFDTDTVQNKVISNKLGYQLYKMVELSSSVSVDISAARFYSESITSWSSSGGIFYKDITHNFNNYYPIVKVSKTINNNYIEAKKIEAISSNVIRIWLEDNILLDAVIFG